MSDAASFPRTILHVDMDAFFASVEQRDDPALRGRPVLVAFDGPRGVVCAASYEARRFGCRSAQPTAVAKRQCPEAVIVPPVHQRYADVSHQIFAILESFTPLVEPLSIDEAFMDVTGSVPLFGDGVAMARRVRQRVRDELDLAASVGVAPNKFMAKLASDLDKPDGLTVLTMDDVAGRMAALPIERLWGVGPKAAARLRELGLRTFGDVQARELPAMPPGLGALAPHIWHLARGDDDRAVVPDHGAKSISHEQTFGADLEAAEAALDVLLQQTERVAERLRRGELQARTVTVKVRSADFHTVTRSHTLDRPSNATGDLWQAARDLFTQWARWHFEPVRLIGMGASNLVGADDERQLDLFEAPDHARRLRVDETADAIRRRFGGRSIHRGLMRSESGS